MRNWEDWIETQRKRKKQTIRKRVVLFITLLSAKTMQGKQKKILLFRDDIREPKRFKDEF